jgi:hypothetical protein
LALKRSFLSRDARPSRTSDPPSPRPCRTRCRQAARSTFARSAHPSLGSAFNPSSPTRRRSSQPAPVVPAAGSAGPDRTSRGAPSPSTGRRRGIRTAANPVRADESAQPSTSCSATSASKRALFVLPEWLCYRIVAQQCWRILAHLRPLDLGSPRLNRGTWRGLESQSNFVRAASSGA